MTLQPSSPRRGLERASGHRGEDCAVGTSSSAPLPTQGPIPPPGLGRPPMRLKIRPRLVRRHRLGSNLPRTPSGAPQWSAVRPRHSGPSPTRGKSWAPLWSPNASHGGASDTARPECANLPSRPHLVRVRWLRHLLLSGTMSASLRLSATPVSWSRRDGLAAGRGVPDQPRTSDMPPGEGRFRVVGQLIPTHYRVCSSRGSICGGRQSSRRHESGEDLLSARPGRPGKA